MTAWIERLVAVEAIAEQATRLALSFFDEVATLEVTAKHPQDLVSRADVEMEHFLRDKIETCFPGESVMGEELGGHASGDCWVLDPIDGTANFISGSPLWGVAISYQKEGEAVVGAVAYPALGYTLSAASGSGLRRNGQHVRRTQHRSHLQVVAVGENIHWPPEKLGEIELKLRKQGWGIAGYRCATIGLGFAAQGLVDGYLEAHTSLWDISSGSLLCQEAGLEVQTCGTEHRGGMTVMTGIPSLMSSLNMAGGTICCDDVTKSAI
ncbi:inositol monophosphatase family protein [Pseudomonas sp. S1_E04]